MNTKNRRSKGRKQGEILNEKRTVPIRNYFIVLCSNRGVNLLCDTLYSVSALQDSSIASHKVLQLKYCTCLALYARCAQIATRYGYAREVPEVYRLMSVTKALQLPVALARYIECVGKFEMATGCNVVPWFSTREAMENEHLHPVMLNNLLEQAERPIPDNYWSVDSDWISNWNIFTLRPSGTHCQAINWDDLSGSAEMIVTPVPVSRDAECLQPYAPQVITNMKAQLGAVYDWRRYDDLQYWPEQTALICTKLVVGDKIYPDLFWSNHVNQLHIDGLRYHQSIMDESSEST